LRLRNGEQIAAQLGQLGFEGGAFLLALRDLQGQPEDQGGEKNSEGDKNGGHLLLLYAQRKEFTTRRSREQKDRRIPIYFA
jgi:hypothetical protein